MPSFLFRTNDEVPVIERFAHGQVKCQGRSVDEMRDGRWTDWFDHGQKQEEGEYRQGRKVGVWTHWVKTG